MKTKRSHFRRVRRLLQYLHRGTHRWEILILLAMFLAIGVLSPSFAFITPQNSIVQSVPNAQELFEQGRNFYETEQFNRASLVFDLAKKLTKAEALRQAQRALLNNPKYQHPLFWAAYVLVGNWL